MSPEPQAHRDHRTHIRPPVWALWATAPAILLVLAFGLWLRLDSVGPTPIDEAWLHLVGLVPDTVPYWAAVTFAEVGGGVGAIICTGLLAAAFVILRRFRAAVYLVTTMALGIALSEGIKALVTRIRPTEQLYDSLGWSYPSGHSMGAAALATALAIIATRSALQQRALRGPDARPDSAALATPDAQHRLRLGFHWSQLLALTWMLTMMWSRTALQVHWLTDTIAGMLIGISAAILADELWTLVTKRARSPLLEK
ncbi:phosphatase PAP2 family protein [Brevibacterium atlanticum]|uniref:phosphatase PAP2 family protein n=1 Tax=Brevibacterium atlanticum TaxID=2697563 RepID=UPI00141F58D8|nr:phosphatase PAP2 family protein [Brevibacterium atlanticum]